MNGSPRIIFVLNPMLMPGLEPSLSSVLSGYILPLLKGVLEDMHISDDETRDPLDSSSSSSDSIDGETVQSEAMA